MSAPANHPRKASRYTANYIFKQSYGKYSAIAAAFSFFLHIFLVLGTPEFRVEITADEAVKMEALELPPEVMIPPPPKPLTKPSIPMEAEEEIEEDITIEETTPPPPDLIPEMAQVQDNIDAEEFLMVAEVMPKWKYKPPAPKIPGYIARARVKAVTRIVFFVKKTGEVDQQRTKVALSSGYQDLDRLAIAWANKGKFHPALQRGEPVAVRVGYVFDWSSS